jgi:hypothetical protein
MHTFLRKLSSRKLWIAVVGIVVGLATTFGIQESDYNEVAGMVTTVASVVGYLFAESRVDAAGAIPLILPPGDASDDDTEDIPEVGAEEQ